MPIKDRTMGVLEAVNKRDGVFTASDVTILSVTAAHAAIAINNARLLRATQQALEKVKVTNQIKSNFLALAPTNCGLRSASSSDTGHSCRKVPRANSRSRHQVLNAAVQMRSLLDQMKNLTLLQSDEMEMKR